MRLDSARNHLMLLNLWLSMVSISLTVTTILPSAYGMNIEHGMEGAMWFFYAVGGFSLLGGCGGRVEDGGGRWGKGRWGGGCNSIATQLTGRGSKQEHAATVPLLCNSRRRLKPAAETCRLLGGRERRRGGGGEGSRRDGGRQEGVYSKLGAQGHHGSAVRHRLLSPQRLQLPLSPPPSQSALSPTTPVHAAGVLSYPMALSIYKRQWRKDSQQELNKVKRLR